MFALNSARISIRMLMDQHLMVYGYERSPPDNVGVINPQTDIRAILTEAYEDAKFLCEQGYMDVPRLKLVESTIGPAGVDRVTPLCVAMAGQQMVKT